MKFEFNEKNKFQWEGLTGFPYSTKEEFPNASTTYFKITGSHGKVKSTKSDRIYFVISGKGEFIVEEKVTPVKEKDVIIIPKNTPYDYRALNGEMDLFLVHTPAYDADAEIKL